MTMELVNNTAEFRAESHFNLHLEGAGEVSLYRRTSGSGWDFVKTLSGGVIDEDVAVTIPKEWKIDCQNKPSLVVITHADGTVIDIDIPDDPSGDEPSEPEQSKVISFTTYGDTMLPYYAERGMTWEEWCVSSYNEVAWIASGTGVVMYMEDDPFTQGGFTEYLTYKDGELVKPTDEIIDGGDYDSVTWEY